MKLKSFFIGLVVVIAAGGLICAYIIASQERGAEAEGEKPVASKTQIQSDGSGNVTVRLEEEQQKLLALKTEPLAPTQFRPEIKAYGRVLDPTPLATLANDLESARAAVEVSRQEFERLKALSAQNNASARDLQTAEAAALRDKAKSDSSYQQMLAAWGKALTDRDDLSEFIQSLALHQKALVRLDLLAGDFLKTPPTEARLSTVSDESNFAEAQFISEAPTIEPQAQGQGFFFLLATNRPQFLPGASVTAYLPISGEPLAGVEVPRGAVVKFNGQSWIYLETGENSFTRREISLEHPTAGGWFVTSGAKPNERVVTTGGQMLLSEEQKYQIQIGD